MINLEMTNEGPLLIIKIDTGKRFGLTGSGKNFVVASTQGTAPVALPGIPNGVYINLTCHQKPTIQELAREIGSFGEA